MTHVTAKSPGFKAIFSGAKQNIIAFISGKYKGAPPEAADAKGGTAKLVDFDDDDKIIDRDPLAGYDAPMGPDAPEADGDFLRSEETI